MAKAEGEAFASMVTKANTPYEEIIDSAKKRKCEAIFMDSHTRCSFSKLIMGSVTQNEIASIRMAETTIAEICHD